MPGLARVPRTGGENQERAFARSAFFGGRLKSITQRSYRSCIAEDLYSGLASRQVNQVVDERIAVI